MDSASVEMTTRTCSDRRHRRAKDGVEIRRRVQRVGDRADGARLVLARRGLLLALAGPVGGGAELLGQRVHLGDAGVERLSALAAFHRARDPDVFPDGRTAG